MLIHLDTSVLVDAFTGTRRSLRHVESATVAGDILAFSALVGYEWLGGDQTQAERDAVGRLFGNHATVPFGEQVAARAASLFRTVARDFDDIPDLMLYRPRGQ